MLVKNAENFKKFLNATLEKSTCHADPIAVGRYIFALVKKDKSPEELRKYLLNELEIFLSKSTGEFVDLLFEAIRTESYMKEDPSDGPNKGKTPEISHKTKKVNENAKGAIELPEPTDRNRSKTKPKDAKEEISEECDTSQPSHTSPKSSIKGDHESDNKFEKKEAVRIKKTISSEGGKRCSDYDHKGFCMAGDLCRFDHGKDPILVDDVSEVKFHFTKEGDRFIEAPPLPPSSPPVQPPPPPPPPPLPSLPPPINAKLLGTNVPQPYNPEYPGYWGTTTESPKKICDVSTPPPPIFFPSTTPAHPPSSFYVKNSKQKRTRELIGIQIESKVASCFDSSPSNLELKRKSTFDFKRLGPPRKKPAYNSRNTLELRNVPVELNNIDLLNRHFSKFGSVASLEIGYENDPQSALVKFLDPNDALVAFRSSDAILNNRFIKVFFKKDSYPDSENSITLPLKNNEKTLDESLGNNSIEISAISENEKVNDKEGSIKMHASVFSSKEGNLSRTVFNPAALKNFSSTKNNSTTRKLEKKEDANSLEKKILLLRRKKEFLLSSIEHQKLIVEKMVKCKNPKELNYLKETIENLTSKISNLKDEIKHDSKALKNHLLLLKPVPGVTKSEAERKLLDAEMDLYREKSTKGPSLKDETAELLSRVHELQQKAKAFIDGSSSTVDSTHKHSKLKKSLPVSSESSDHLPRKIMDTQSSSEQNTDCLKDSLQSKNIETEIIEGDDEEEDDEEDSEARSWRR